MIGQLRNNIKENADHFVIVNPWMLIVLRANFYKSIWIQFTDNSKVNLLNRILAVKISYCCFLHIFLGWR